MNYRRKRGQNFSTEEKLKLIRIIVKHRNTILNKKTDKTSNDAKLAAWTEITASFNTASSYYRSKQSLIKAWEKMKYESKTYCSSRRSNSKPRGALSIVGTDLILEKVCTLMGRGSTGIKSEPIEICFIDSPSNSNISVHNSSSTIPETVTKTFTPLSDEPKEIQELDEATPLPQETKPLHSCCSQDVFKKLGDVEELQCTLLKEELEFKRKSYKLQLELAQKELILKDLNIKIKQAELDNILGTYISKVYSGREHDVSASQLG